MDPNQANLFLAALKNHLQGTTMAGMADYLTGLHQRTQTPAPPLPPAQAPAIPMQEQPQALPQGLARYASAGAPQQAPPAVPAFGTPRERAGSGAAPPGNRLAMYAY